MIVLFDDAAYYIDIDDVSYKCLHNNEYYECVRILLTTKQWEKYVIDCTNREFKVSEKRIEEFDTYINDYENNVWRKQSK